MAKNDPLDHEMYFKHLGAQMRYELRDLNVIRCFIEMLNLTINVILEAI